MNKKVEIFVSAPILAEYHRVLSYPRLSFAPKQVSAFMTRLSASSVVVEPSRRVTISAEEADNRFQECAEAAAADYLVTGNKKHFPKRWKKSDVVNARELLALIGSSFLDRE